MNVLDIAIVVAVIFHMISGYRRGFVRMVTDIIAFAGGIIVAITYSPIMAKSVYDAVGLTPPFDRIVAFIIIWAVFFILVSVFGNMAHRTLKFSVFKPMNKAGGLAVGAIKGFVIILPIISPLIYLNVQVVDDSVIIKPIKPILASMVDEFSNTDETTSALNPTLDEGERKKAKAYIKNQLKAPQVDGLSGLSEALPLAADGTPDDLPPEIEEILKKNGIDWKTLMKSIDES